MCFKPDGSQLIVAAGQRVLVYDASDGKFTTLIYTVAAEPGKQGKQMLPQNFRIH